MYRGPSTTPTPSPDEPDAWVDSPEIEFSEEPGAWLDAPEADSSGDESIGAWVFEAERGSRRARQPWVARKADAEHREAMRRRVRFEIAVNGARDPDRLTANDLGHLWRSAAGS